jgi:hypothetical protein
MPYQDSAYLLEACRDLSGRPATDASMPAARWYRFLTEAQQHWWTTIAAFAPEALVSEPTLMTSTDGGYTYSIPGATTPPYGLAEVRAKRNGELLRIGPEWSGADFTVEGASLRVPHNRPRNFGDGPYIRYAAVPDVIDAETEPTLPLIVRRLLAPHACWIWASRPPNPADPRFYLAMEQRYWMGDPNTPGDTGIMGVLGSQYLGGDGEEFGEDASAWWRSGDLG